MMQLNIAKEVAALKRLAVSELRHRYAEVFGEATGARNKAWLIKRIAWRLQALAEGDLSQRARDRAAELAQDADLRLSPPRVRPVAAQLVAGAVGSMSGSSTDARLPPPGSSIARVYKGERLEVRVLEQGFEFEGSVYRTLSAVARAITGSHCNGYLFFRLTQGKTP